MSHARALAHYTNRERGTHTHQSGGVAPPKPCDPQKPPCDGPCQPAAACHPCCTTHTPAPPPGICPQLPTERLKGKEGSTATEWRVCWTGAQSTEGTKQNNHSLLQQLLLLGVPRQLQCGTKRPALPLPHQGEGRQGRAKSCAMAAAAAAAAACTPTAAPSPQPSIPGCRAVLCCAHAHRPKSVSGCTHTFCCSVYVVGLGL